jgi:hypothetical protein
MTYFYYQETENIFGILEDELKLGVIIIFCDKKSVNYFWASMKGVKVFTSHN